MFEVQHKTANLRSTRARNGKTHESAAQTKTPLSTGERDWCKAMEHWHKQRTNTWPSHQWLLHDMRRRRKCRPIRATGNSRCLSGASAQPDPPVDESPLNGPQARLVCRLLVPPLPADSDDHALPAPDPEATLMPLAALQCAMLLAIAPRHLSTQRYSTGGAASARMMSRPTVLSKRNARGP